MHGEEEIRAKVSVNNGQLNGWTEIKASSVVLKWSQISCLNFFIMHMVEFLQQRPKSVAAIENIYFVFVFISSHRCKI